MPIIYNQKEIIHIPFDLNNALKLPPPQKASYMKDENSARHYQQ